MEKELTEIQFAINNILNVKSLIRRKKKSQSEKKKRAFHIYNKFHRADSN